MTIPAQLALAAPLALLAGVLSFASPCVLPLVPGYLGYVGGSDAAGTRGRSRIVLGAALFVLGFSVVFVVAFVAVGAVGFFLSQYEAVITRAAGVVVIALGLVFVGGLGPLQRKVAPEWRPRAGLIGAPLLGAVFAVGWSPCLGPMLAAIQSLALSSASVGSAVLLAICYSVGLGVPFLLIAVGFGWATSAVGVLRRHIRVVNLAGGALLVVIGLLMVTGLWGAMIAGLQNALLGYEPPL